MKKLIDDSIDPKDDSISLGYSSNVVPLCSICRIKTEKYDDIFQCPQCQRTYDSDREIVEYEDTLMSSHQDEFPEIEGTGSSGFGLMTSDQEGSAVDDLYRQQRRLGVRPDENVIEYEEYIPDVDRD